MRGSFILALLALIGFAFASDVLDLTNDNFDAQLTEHGVVLVEFYAPWCGHCKTLAPKYDQAATQLKGKAALAKVDCTAQEQTCSRFGVRGYPTVKLFRDGQPSDYNGAREVDALVSFMKKQVMPPVSIVSGAELSDFIASERVLIVGFFPDTEGNKEFNIFFDVAKHLRDDFTFAVTTDAEAATTHGAQVPGVVLFKKFDEKKNIFDEELTKATLTTFVKTNAIPTMDDIGPQNYQKFVDSGLPLAYLFVTSANRDEVGPHVEVVAKEFKGKVNFVFIDAQQYGGHAGNLNLKVGEWPAFSVQFPKENLKFPFSGEITTDAIRAHVQGILDGDIQPSIKSQPIPTTQGDVFVLVGKNYEETMSQKNRDVLVEFYAPWCGHCKKLAPIYDELGSFFSKDKQVLIAKMDSTENDLPANAPFQIQGFPTLKFFKADGSIVDYNGDRTLENLKQFIHDNRTDFDEEEEEEEATKVEKDEL